MPEGSVAADTCPACGGRGWVVRDDGGAGTAEPCPCRGETLAQRLLAATGIPPLYRGKRLSNFKTASHDEGVRGQLQRALSLSRRYVEEFLTADGRFTTSGLIYVGPTGCGKTHLATAVLVELVERYRVRGRFVDCTALLQELQSSFDPRSPASRGDLLDPVLDADVVVLDELGAQKPTPWVQDVLYLIINSRYTAQRPTLFSTNFSLEPPASGEIDLDRGPQPLPGGSEPLAHRLSANLVSRLHEMAKPVVLDAVADFRWEVRRTAHR